MPDFERYQMIRDQSIRDSTEDQLAGGSRAKEKRGACLAKRRSQIRKGRDQAHLCRKLVVDCLSGDEFRDASPLDLSTKRSAHGFRGKLSTGPTARHVTEDSPSAVVRVHVARLTRCLLAGLERLASHSFPAASDPRECAVCRIGPLSTRRAAQAEPMASMPLTRMIRYRMIRNRIAVHPSVRA
jgi:hypothetical protein